MRFTRRQLLACCLALGVIGLVATADPPSKNAAPVKPAAPAPSHWVVVAEPLPSLPAGVPVCNLPPSLPMPSTYPTVEPPLAAPVYVHPPVYVPPDPAVPLQLELPKVEAAKIPPKVELPEIKVAPPLMHDLPKVETNSLPKAELIPTPVETPKPVAVTMPTIETGPVMSPVMETPKVTQAKAVTPAAFQRIIIDYSSKPLRFEVQSGEITLKVECDAIDVRMPGEQGTTATPLKATGNVKFNAPGCRGVCDEIVLYTASGEAVLHGNVKLQCRQGNVETEVTGTNVKFKLGAAAAGATSPPSR